MTIPDVPPPSVRRRQLEGRREPNRPEGLLAPDEEPAAIEERIGHWHSSVKPWDPFEDWLLGRLAVESVRLEQAEAFEQVLRDNLAHRATHLWDEDRALAAVELAAGLAKHPARVARRLRASFHGCALLIARWQALNVALDALGAWDDARRARALDLLGVAPEAREGDPFGLAAASVEAQRAFATAQIERLTALKEGPLADLDARERANAERGQFAEVPKPLAAVRREIADAKRRFAWAQQQFRKARPGKFAGPSGPGTSPPGGPRPEPPPRPAPPPPPPPPPAPCPEERSEEEIRRRTELLTLMTRRIEAEAEAASLATPPPAPQAVASLPPRPAPVDPAPAAKVGSRRYRRALARARRKQAS